MNSEIKIDSFVITKLSIGNIVVNSVGLIKAINGECAMVFFIGRNEIIQIDFESIEDIDIEKTGKGFNQKICNICHILKKTGEFEINQTDAKGNKTTRPSCRDCRKQIDGVKISREEKMRMDKVKPPKNSIFVCPVCEKRTIVGITANLVRDHDHYTGTGRDWICDSCNTGLGRFKDNVAFIEKVIAYLNRF